MSEKHGRFQRIIAILALIASWGMLIVAIMGWVTNRNKAKDFEKEVISLERRIDILENLIDKKDNQIEELYSESLRRYANNYRKIIRASSEATDDYKRFVHDWGRKEYQDRFAEEKERRFNELKGKLEAIVDHVERYRPLLNPFESTLNGRVDYFHDQLIQDNEDEILKTFATLKESVDSQIDALETQLNRIGATK
jgi:hypothetical protein